MAQNGYAGILIKVLTSRKIYLKNKEVQLKKGQKSSKMTLSL